MGAITSIQAECNMAFPGAHLPRHLAPISVYSTYGDEGSSRHATLAHPTFILSTNLEQGSSPMKQR
jgi:hypothetical protein